MKVMLKLQLAGRLPTPCRPVHERQQQRELTTLVKVKIEVPVDMVAFLVVKEDRAGALVMIGGWPDRFANNARHPALNLRGN